MYIIIPCLIMHQGVGRTLPANCYIQDKGLYILYHRLCHSSDVTINQLWLEHSGLTMQSSFMISELSVKCKVKRLWITVGSSTQLYMDGTKLSSNAAIDLFKALKDNSKQKQLYIEENEITDNALHAITIALERNSCLVKLGMWGNLLSSEATINIAQSLEVNNTLQLLGLPDCPEGVQEIIRSLKEVINDKRESQGFLVKLEIKINLMLLYSSHYFYD